MASNKGYDCQDDRSLSLDCNSSDKFSITYPSHPFFCSITSNADLFSPYAIPLFHQSDSLTASLLSVIFKSPLHFLPSLWLISSVCRWVFTLSAYNQYKEELSCQFERFKGQYTYQECLRFFCTFHSIFYKRFPSFGLPFLLILLLSDRQQHYLIVPYSRYSPISDQHVWVIQQIRCINHTFSVTNLASLFQAFSFTNRRRPAYSYQDIAVTRPTHFYFYYKSNNNSNVSGRLNLPLTNNLIIIMQNHRYIAVNTFSRSLNINQIIAIAVILALLIDFFVAVQSNIQDQSNRTCLIILFCLAFVVLFVSTFACCKVDPVDSIIPIYHSKERGTLSSQLHNCLYCQTCQSYVLQTSRHCKVCGRCVAQFDHHCVWINNCIGGNNYRWFFVMILSVTLYLSIFIASVSTLWAQNRWEVYIHSMIANWFFLLPAISFAVPLTLLFILHCYLSCKGITTYQFIVNKRERFSTVGPEKNNTQNITQNNGFTKSNKVGVEVDEVIFEAPADLQTIEHHLSNEHSEMPEKSDGVISQGGDKHSSEEVKENDDKHGTVPVKAQIDLKQFYGKNKSLKMLIGNTILVEEVLPKPQKRSMRRNRVETKAISIEQMKDILN